MKKILHLDSNHPLLIDGLNQLGFHNDLDESSSYDEVLKKIHHYHGIVIRSRIPIDKTLISKAQNLEFIARVGAGLENINTEFAQKNKIHLFAANEGNSNAVAEHLIGLLLNLFNNINKGHHEIKHGLWQREPNRGEEIEGKSIGIIGYGHNGQKFAQKLSSFGCSVLCYDILPNKSDQFAQQVALNTLKEQSDVISLHVPLTDLTKHFIDKTFIDNMSKPFWLLNAARGACVVTKDLLDGLNSGKVRGAGLDVLEFEQSSFDTIFASPSQNLIQLIQHPKVILTPHVAGWSKESYIKLSEVILKKIQNFYKKS